MIIDEISVAIAPPQRAKFFSLVSKEITRSAFEALIYHLRLSLDKKNQHTKGRRLKVPLYITVK